MSQPGDPPLPRRPCCVVHFHSIHGDLLLGLGAEQQGHLHALVQLQPPQPDPTDSATAGLQVAPCCVLATVPRLLDSAEAGFVHLGLAWPRLHTLWNLDSDPCWISGPSDSVIRSPSLTEFRSSFSLSDKDESFCSCNPSSFLTVTYLLEKVSSQRKDGEPLMVCGTCPKDEAF